MAKPPVRIQPTLALGAGLLLTLAKNGMETRVPAQRSAPVAPVPFGGGRNLSVADGFSGLVARSGINSSNPELVNY